MGIACQIRGGGGDLEQMPLPPFHPDRFRGALLGLAVGDALGTTVEFKKAGTFEPVTDMIGGGPFNLPPGAWTDDTSMALCSTHSLIECGEFDPVDQMRCFSRWYRDGYMSSIGTCFDIGGATRASIERFEQTGEPYPGDAGTEQAGNGPIMRFAPHALAYSAHPYLLDSVAGQTCRATHGAKQAIETTRYFAWLLERALAGVDKRKLLTTRWPAAVNLHADVAEVVDGSFRERQPPEVSGDGYIVRTLEAALWGLWNFDDFESGVLAVVNLGRDADTTAAVYGQLAGAVYGIGAIPKRWREQVLQGEEIVRLADELRRLVPSDAPSPKPPHDGWWIEDNRIVGGPYPGALDKDEARAKLGDLLDFGVRLFIDLTEEGEGSPPLKPYYELLKSVAAERDMEEEVAWVRMPIPDIDVPGEAGMRAVMGVLAHGREQPGLIYVHCWGGVGRTGTVAGCHMIERRLPAERALERIAARRAHTDRAGRAAPETAAQREMVEDWLHADAMVLHSAPEESRDDYDEIAEFAMTFDGYGYFDGMDDPVRAAVGAQWMADGTLPDDVDLLRAILFVEFRIDRFTYGDEVTLSEPDAEGVRHVVNNPDFEESVTARYRRALVGRIMELAAAYAYSSINA